MGSHRIKMRLTGTKADLEKWLWLMDKMNEKSMIDILEKSKPYQNRGESQMHRVYLEIDLNVDD